MGGHSNGHNRWRFCDISLPETTINTLPLQQRSLIIRALSKARNELVDLEELSDEELGRLEDQFRRLRTKAENQGTNMRHVEPEALEADR